MPPRDKRRKLNRTDAQGNEIRYVRFKAGDQEKAYIIECEKAAAMKSNVVRNMIEDFGDLDQDIPVVKVPPPVMEKVVEWCTHHKDDPEPPANPSDEDRRWAVQISEWDQKFFDVEHEMLIEIILAANFLEILPLLDVGCKTFAGFLKGKTPEEIREEFNIEDDLTPEEKDEIRRQNEWAII